MGETEGLALVLGRWLDRPGWGAIRRRVGGYFAEPQAIPEPPRRRLETPAGVLVAAPERLPGETALQCVKRVLTRQNVILCDADLTPLDPEGFLNNEIVLIVVGIEESDNDSRCTMAVDGNLGLLRWAIALTDEVDAVITSAVSWAAAQGGHIDILRWALARGCEWDDESADEAAEQGHLELLKWAVANGHRLALTTGDFAARHGHLELVQWAAVNGCLIDGSTCLRAAGGGHLKVLQWLIANGCPWHDDTSWSAAEFGRLEMLKWALANGCPLHPHTRRTAAISGHTDMVEWLDARDATRV